MGRASCLRQRPLGGTEVERCLGGFKVFAVDCTGYRNRRQGRQRRGFAGQFILVRPTVGWIAFLQKAISLLIRNNRMEKTTHIIALFFCLCIASGCVGPATKDLHSLSLRFDPPPECYLAAWKSESHVYVKYRPREPVTDTQVIYAPIYWASVPLTILDGYNQKGWTIYRKTPPDIPSQEHLKPIPIVSTSGAGVRNRDPFITDMIEDHGGTLPILLYDSNTYYKFHLVGPKGFYGSYGGLCTPPHGRFRDKSVILVNSWKYPLCMVADIILYPWEKILDHALSDLH